MHGIISEQTQLVAMGSSYSMMTGQTTETIIKDLDRDNFLSAYEAEEYGLVDRVLEYNKDTDTQLWT